jgi:hypothetical protein
MTPMKLMLFLEGLYHVSNTISNPQFQSNLQNLSNKTLLIQKVEGVVISNEKVIQQAMSLQPEHLNNPAMSPTIKESILKTMWESNERMRTVANNSLNSKSDLENNNIESVLDAAETTVRVAGDVTTYILNHSSELTQFSQFSVSLLDSASFYAQYASTVAPVLGC